MGLTINPKWCKGCGICVAFCPKKVLVLDDQGKASAAAPDKCTKCRLCELRCPDFAISLDEPDEEANGGEGDGLEVGRQADAGQ